MNKTHTKLITAAVSCFADKGFAATSVREIAAQAGVSLGALYTYFRSKDDLILSIITDEQKASLITFDEPYSSSHLQRIYDVIALCLDEVGYPSSHNRMWVEIMAESSRNSRVRELFIASDIVMRGGLEKILNRGIDDGEFRPDLPVREISALLFSMLDGLMSRKAINSDFNLSRDMPGFLGHLGLLLSANHP